MRVSPLLFEHCFIFILFSRFCYSVLFFLSTALLLEQFVSFALFSWSCYFVILSTSSDLFEHFNFATLLFLHFCQLLFYLFICSLCLSLCVRVCVLHTRVCVYYTHTHTHTLWVDFWLSSMNRICH